MNFILLIKESLSVLKTNKKRTFLTSLGIIIGVAGVIMVMSVGTGAQSLIFGQISSAGSNLIGILPGYSDEEGPPVSVMGITVTSLKNADIEEISKLKEIKAAAGYVRGVETITYLNKKIDTTYIGTMPSYIFVEDAQTEIGSFFSNEDNKTSNKVAVLGWQVWKDLFGDEDPVGKRIKIKRENFRVIGVMEKRGTKEFQNQDTLVFIPIETAQKIMLGIKHVSMARIKVYDEKNISFVMSQIEDILRERHHIAESNSNDFIISSSAQNLKALESVTEAIKFFLSTIAAISLIVGGIGIMNIMLISVRERTREIGLRKAIGATSSIIQAQFLIETLALTLSGGVAGIVIGSAFAGIIAIIARYLGYDWDYVITVQSVFAGVAVSSSVGIIFGWYPARRAANLDPVSALHYE